MFIPSVLWFSREAQVPVINKQTPGKYWSRWEPLFSMKSRSTCLPSLLPPPHSLLYLSLKRPQWMVQGNIISSEMKERPQWPVRNAMMCLPEWCSQEIIDPGFVLKWERGVCIVCECARVMYKRVCLRRIWSYWLLFFLSVHWVRSLSPQLHISVECRCAPTWL